MRSCMLLLAGCLLALGIASCEKKADEPAKTDTLATTPVDTTTHTIDTAGHPPVDTLLMNRVDTAVIRQDTTVIPGKSTTKTTTSGKETGKTTTAKPATTTPTTTGSTSGENKPVGAKSTRKADSSNKPVGAGRAR